MPAPACVHRHPGNLTVASAAPGHRHEALRLMDIKALRQSLGFMQAQFAARLGFCVATLRHCERGDCTPKGPALVSLNVIQCEPKAVLRTLAA